MAVLNKAIDQILLRKGGGSRATHLDLAVGQS